ncbi:MAG: hypothetical protein ACFFCH_01860 [Promethearchaeota archaeon]
MTSIPKDGVLSSSSERLAEPSFGAAMKLKGFSHFLVAKRNSLNLFNDESTLVYIRPGLYAKPRQPKSKPQTSLFATSDLLTFIPRRDTTSLGKNETIVPGSARRYLMVVFTPLRTEFQRKGLSRIFHRTPLIRLRPGIVLLPQIRTRRVRLYSPALLRPSEFISRLLELGAEVQYAPRLELVHSSSDQAILELIRSNQTNRAQRLIKTCRNLFNQIKAEPRENGNQRKFIHQFHRLRSQMRLFRKQAQFFQNEFRIDLSDLVNRVASAVTKVNHRLKFCDTSK